MANKCYVLLLEDGTLEIDESPWDSVQKRSRKAVKGFKSVTEAEKFISAGGFSNEVKTITTNNSGVSKNSENKSADGVIEYSDYVKNWDMKNAYAFTDGSYNSETKVYGCGGFLVVDGEKIKIQASGFDQEMASMHNVAGEILGCMKALEMAIEKNITYITIFYDYLGIQKWVDGSWKAKNEKTANYRDFVRGLIDLGINIDFVHAKGHTGIDGNEEADQLAKEAVGIK